MIFFNIQHYNDNVFYKIKLLSESLFKDIMFKEGQKLAPSTIQLLTNSSHFR